MLLIDLDLQFGDAAIMLGLDPKRTMYELVQSPGELDPGKLASYTTRHRSGLDVLAAPMLPEHAELVTEAKVLRLVEVAREAYDLVVIDTSPFFYGPMLALLGPTDQLLLLCGLDVPTLKNVRLSLRTLELLGFPPDRTNLVLNRVTPSVGLTAEDVADALGLPVAFEVPNDPVVAPAVNRGTVPSLHETESEFAQALARIASAIQPTIAAPPSRQAALARSDAEASTPRIAARDRREGVMDLENQLRGDAAGAGSAKLTERLNERAPKTHRLLTRQAMVSGDPYGELKTRVQRAVHREARPAPVRKRDGNERPAQAGHGRGHAGDRPGGGDAAVAERPRAADPRADGRHPRLRPDRAVPRRRRGDRGHGQRLRTASTSSAPARSSRPTPRSSTTTTCCGSSTRSSRRSDGASTSRRRWSTHGLPDGSRVNAIIPPLSLHGPTLTIRKFSRDPYTIDDLIDFGTLTPKASGFLQSCVQGKLNMLISGGTGTGKTTTAERAVGRRSRRRSGS